MSDKSDKMDEGSADDAGDGDTPMVPVAAAPAAVTPDAAAAEPEPAPAAAAAPPPAKEVDESSSDDDDDDDGADEGRLADISALKRKGANGSAPAQQQQQQQQQYQQQQQAPQAPMMPAFMPQPAAQLAEIREVTQDIRTVGCCGRCLYCLFTCCPATAFFCLFVAFAIICFTILSVQINADFNEQQKYEELSSRLAIALRIFGQNDAADKLEPRSSFGSISARYDDLAADEFFDQMRPPFFDPGFVNNGGNGPVPPGFDPDGTPPPTESPGGFPPGPSGFPPVPENGFPPFPDDYPPGFDPNGPFTGGSGQEPEPPFNRKRQTPAEDDDPHGPDPPSGSEFPLNPLCYNSARCRIIYITDEIVPLCEEEIIARWQRPERSNVEGTVYKSDHINDVMNLMTTGANASELLGTVRVKLTEANRTAADCRIVPGYRTVWAAKVTGGAMNVTAGTVLKFVMTYAADRGSRDAFRNRVRYGTPAFLRQSADQLAYSRFGAVGGAYYCDELAQGIARSGFPRFHYRQVGHDVLIAEPYFQRVAADDPTRQTELDELAKSLAIAARHAAQQRLPTDEERFSMDTSKTAGGRVFAAIQGGIQALMIFCGCVALMWCCACLTFCYHMRRGPRPRTRRLKGRPKSNFKWMFHPGYHGQQFATILLQILATVLACLGLYYAISAAIDSGETLVQVFAREVDPVKEQYDQTDMIPFDILPVCEDRATRYDLDETYRFYPMRHEIRPTGPDPYLNGDICGVRFIGQVASNEKSGSRAVAEGIPLIANVAYAELFAFLIEVVAVFVFLHDGVMELYRSFSAAEQRHAKELQENEFKVDDGTFKDELDGRPTGFTPVVAAIEIFILVANAACLIAIFVLDGQSADLPVPLPLHAAVQYVGCDGSFSIKPLQRSRFATPLALDDYLGNAAPQFQGDFNAAVSFLGPDPLRPGADTRQWCNRQYSRETDNGDLVAVQIDMIDGRVSFWDTERERVSGSNVSTICFRQDGSVPQDELNPLIFHSDALFNPLFFDTLYTTGPDAHEQLFNSTDACGGTNYTRPAALPGDMPAGAFSSDPGLRARLEAVVRNVTDPLVGGYYLNLLYGGVTGACRVVALETDPVRAEGTTQIFNTVCATFDCTKVDLNARSAVTVPRDVNEIRKNIAGIGDIAIAGVAVDAVAVALIVVAVFCCTRKKRYSDDRFQVVKMIDAPEGGTMSAATMSAATMSAAQMGAGARPLSTRVSQNPLTDPRASASHGGYATPTRGSMAFETAPVL